LVGIAEVNHVGEKWDKWTKNCPELSQNFNRSTTSNRPARHDATNLPESLNYNHACTSGHAMPVLRSYTALLRKVPNRNLAQQRM
jgi:hypothetical protein